MKWLDRIRSRLTGPRKITEITGPPEVGATYLVPVVPTFLRGGVAKVPVILHPHRDPELGDNTLHVHFDGRFVTDEERADWVKRHGANRVATVPIGYAFSKEPDDWYAWESRRCLREWHGADILDQQRDGDLSSVGGLDELCKDMVCRGRYCPHKGFDLRGVKPDGDGSVTCPLHGATWGADGRYIPRRNVGQEMLMKLFREHPGWPDRLTMTMRFFSGFRTGRPGDSVPRLSPEMLVEDFDECVGYTPPSFEVDCDRDKVRIGHPKQKVLFTEAVDIRGYFLTLAGCDRPAWAQVFAATPQVEPGHSIELAEPNWNAS